jgi:uncharacterized membrane protein YoaK (UPF0700 family)
MKKQAARSSPRAGDSRVVPSKTLIETIKTTRKSARVLGGEFFGVTALSLVGGFVDTAGFIALFGIFTAHVTGDLITGAAALTQGLGSGGLVRLLMIPVFMVTVAIAMLFLRAISARGAHSVAPLLALMTLVMAAFGASGWYFSAKLKSIGNWEVILTSGLGVAAMGFQNALMRGALKGFSQTTMMTGNLTQFTIDFIERIFPQRLGTPREQEAARLKARTRLRKSAFPLFAFMAGAALGAWLTSVYGLLSIAVPTGILFVLTIITAWRSRLV